MLLALDGNWTEAITSYDGALDYVANDHRGNVKVRAGRALVRYLQDLDAGGDGRAATEETAALVEVARQARATDVLERAEANVEIMRRGSRALHPYEFL